MHDKIIEATNVLAGGINYGKFMVCQFPDEGHGVSEVA